MLCKLQRVGQYIHRLPGKESLLAAAVEEEVASHPPEHGAEQRGDRVAPWVAGTIPQGWLTIMAHLNVRWTTVDRVGRAEVSKGGRLQFLSLFGGAIVPVHP